MELDDHDAFSLPDPSTLSAFVAARQSVKVLFIDSTVEPIAGTEARVGTHLEDIALLPGTWCFRHHDGIHAVVFQTGVGPSIREYQTRVQPGTPTWAAWMTFKLQWDSAPSRDRPAPIFNVGTAVVVRGGDGRVGTVIRPPTGTHGGWEYQIRFDASTVRVLEPNLQMAVTDATSAVEWLSSPTVDHRWLTLLLTGAKLEHSLTDVLYSFGSTRTVFRSYQFKPLLKLLNSSTQRLLIADEVGLGKTIEAGLIWSEVDRRSGIRRGLVVCPASLTRKWQGEMKRRFDRDLEILDRRRLGEIVQQLREGRDPRIAGIISLESLRTAPEIDALAEMSPRMDIVIVDEAHALRNSGSKSFALGGLLSDWADVLLFLSATPLNLGRHDLYNLLNLLSPEDYPDPLVFEDQLAPNEAINSAIVELRRPDVTPDAVEVQLKRLHGSTYGRNVMSRPEFARASDLLAGPSLDTCARSELMRLLMELNTLSTTVTRTRKVDTPDAKAKRVAREIQVEWTEEESELYDAILDWSRTQALRDNGIVGFATIMPLRQAASSLQASRQVLLGKWPALGVDDDFDDLDGLDDVDQVMSALEEAGRGLKTALRALGDTDTKFDRFLENLQELRREGLPQVMVFSFFRATLRYLFERLSPAWRVRVMDGSIKRMDERARIMQDFRDGLFDILLVSEVGSEGLDFEFCGALVNYDMPWNPMRVEQRIGRLDRFGQKFEKIHILNFHVPGTIETDIFERLYQRIRVFEESIGELEPIIRDDLNDLTKLIIDPRRSEAERDEEIARIELALENRRSELELLQSKSDNLLTGLDQILIDGFERDTRDRGKHVGEAEIEQVLGRFLQNHGGALRAPKKGERFYQIIGTPDVARAAQSAIRHSEGPQLDRLVSPLRDGEPILATFSPTLAMESAAEFMTLSHPLVHAASADLARSYVPPNRFAAVSLPGLSRNVDALALVGLVEVNGIRPIRELRCSAIDIRDGSVRDEIGDLLFSAHARGDLSEFDLASTPTVAQVMVLEDQMRAACADLEKVIQLTNTALIEGRAITLRRTFGGKIQRSLDTLSKVTAQNRSESIQRLHKGTVARLRTELDLALEKLAAQHDFAVVWRPLALVAIRGAG